MVFQKYDDSLDELRQSPKFGHFDHIPLMLFIPESLHSHSIPVLFLEYLLHPSDLHSCHVF